MDNMEDIKSIIQNSGNSFHCKVLNYLKDKDWYTLVSPYYTDTITDKPREIDIVAEKAYPYDNAFRKGTINVKLYIECKYIPQNVVFWFDNKDMEKANDWVLKNTPHREKNTYKDMHHYLNKDAKVAKLFAGSSGKNLENEGIYRAMNQCLNAVVYNRRRGSIILSKSSNISKTIEYPVILCNSFDNFFSVGIKENNNPKKINENFQLEVNYAYLDLKKNHRNEYFLIDVIDYYKIDEFLSVLEKDVESIKKILWTS